MAEASNYLIIQIIYYIFVFVLGLVIGSFLNVCIYRIPKEISVAKGRSICPKCNCEIKWYHNIPLISYMCLRGKCAYCKEIIAVRYPIVELLCAVCFLAVSVKYGITWQTLIYFVFVSCLITLAYIDIDTGEIPNRFSIIIVGLGVISIFLNNSLVSSLIGAVCISVPMLCVALITKGFGGGDIKLMAASGLLLGVKLTVFAAFTAIVLGGIFAIVLLIRKKSKGKDKMIFGQFLAIGMFISLLIGEITVNAYLKIFT